LETFLISKFLYNLGVKFVLSDYDINPIDLKFDEVFRNNLTVSLSIIVFGLFTFGLFSIINDIC